MLPDLEIPVILPLVGFQGPNRMVLHSLLGGMTVGTLLALAITVWIYPSVASRILTVSKLRVGEKCSLSIGLVLSCFIGILSHVLLDVTNHDYNPVFWPFLGIYETPSPITPLLGGALTASIIVHLLMALLFVGIFFKTRDNFWEKALVE